MKNLFIIISIFLISITCRAQAVLEHDYQDQNIFGPTKLNNYGWIYAGVHYGQPKNDVWIYSENHSLLKTIPIQYPSGYSFYIILNVSDNLFNSDNKIEVLYLVQKSNPPDFKMMLINEDGATIQIFDHTSWAFIYNLDGNFKMKTTGYGDSTMSVYALPGTMVDVPVIDASGSTSVFPNPCTNYVDISYSLSATGITVFNANGIEVYRSGLMGSGDLRINTQNFKPGNYVYRIEYNNRSGESGKFTVLK